IHCKFQHFYGGWRFLQYFLSPLIGGIFKLLMGNHRIDHTHFKSFLSTVVSSKEEYFSSFFLADHFGQVGRAVTAVKASNVSVSLLEYGMFLTGEGQITHHMQTMSSSNSPTRNYGNNHLRHKPNETLDF